MSYFLNDIEQDTLISWDYLIKDINDSTTYNPYCKTKSYYQVFKHIVISMLIETEIILLDSDFTDSELTNLINCKEFEKFSQPITKRKSLICFNKDELIDKLRKTGNTWRMALFTSGTTGIPKKVIHDFTSITRFVKIFQKDRNYTWGYAYNPTHMAGVQVFFQALLNGNSIVRLFGLSMNVISNLIIENKITHISATPTFYKLLLSSKITFETIIRITSGGEKLDEKTISQLKKLCPNSKITNVYALTEAGTLLASENDIFSIKSAFKDLIRIINFELQIHNSLIGSTDINIMEWYNTGDLVEVISESPFKFRFISRKSDMVNVGGYKVNLLEVEEAILSFHEITNARVYSKKNSVLGNIICCEVVCENNQITESLIRKFLQSKIQEFKIPRFIKFVDKIAINRAGKIKRN